MGRITGNLKERTLSFGTKAMAALAGLPNEPRSWVLGKQLGRSATSIGANVWEADAAFTDSDFVYKISIARKEASETEYWLELARRLELIPHDEHAALAREVNELTKVLGTIVRKTQEHISRSGSR